MIITATPIMKASDILSFVYIGLTMAKLLQWLAIQYKYKKSYSETTATKKIELKPSHAIWIFLLDIISTTKEHGMVGAQKIPRKDFRIITDSWLEDYNNNNNNNNTKTTLNNGKRQRRQQQPRKKKFTSMISAKRDFFVEFCQESSSFLVDFTAATWVPFLRQPLGIMSLVSISIFIVCTPILIVREILLMGGNSFTFLCKLAASSTIVDLYVVSCKEKLSYDESLFKYGWVSDVFTRQQPHPLIGKAVCPMYKRIVYFPNDDVMDFEYIAISTKVGILLLKETTTTTTTTTKSSTTRIFFKRLLQMLLFGFDDNNEDNDLLPCHFIYLSFLLVLICTEGLVEGILLNVSKYAIPFYFTRTIVDQSLGIEWLAPMLP